MSAAWLLLLLLLAITVLACWGKNRTAYTILQMGQHILQPEEDEAESIQKGGGRKVARHVTPLMKRKIAEKYGWKCNCGCGQKLTFDYHVDHLIPLWKGGTNDEANLQPLNPRCHLLKTSLENQRS